MFNIRLTDSVWLKMTMLLLSKLHVSAKIRFSVRSMSTACITARRTTLFQLQSRDTVLPATHPR